VTITVKLSNGYSLTSSHPFSAWTLLIGRQEGHLAYKKLDVGDDLTASFAQLIAPVVQLSSLTTSIILCFNKHRITEVHLQNGR